MEPLVIGFDLAADVYLDEISDLDYDEITAQGAMEDLTLLISQWRVAKENLESNQ